MHVSLIETFNINLFPKLKKKKNAFIPVKVRGSTDMLHVSLEVGG